MNGADTSRAAGPLKILCVVSHSSAGGAQEILVNLAEGLMGRGHQVTLAALYPFRADIRETPPELPWTYAVPTRPTSIGKQLGMFGSLVRLLKDTKADVALTALPAANTMVPLAATFAGVGTRVVTSHHSPSDTYSKPLNLLDSFAGSLPAVEHIVGVSKTVTNSLERKPSAYRRKTRVIYNALPPAIELLTADLAAGRQPGRGRTVVATGRLAAQKNYPVLIRAARHLPEVTFKIVGHGPDSEALKAMALEAGVADRVEFMGFRPRREALEVLAGGDVFVQPSLYEGHSLALVEAAKLGLPLVVSDAPSQVEGVKMQDGPAALIVPVHDDVALAEAIRSLLEDPLLYRQYADRSRALGDAASFERMLDAYEELARN
jgi:glycosyltransferase involved in cell wall biosynthesis